MVAAEKCVCPGTGPLERSIAVDYVPREQVLFLSISFEAVVCARPDAFLVAHFAGALVGAATRAVALVLGALRLGTKIGDFGQGAIAAIAAVEGEHFHEVLGAMQRAGELGGAFDDLVELLPHPKTSEVFFESQAMDQPVEGIGDGRRWRMLPRAQIFAVAPTDTQEAIEVAKQPTVAKLLSPAL